MDIVSVKKKRYFFLFKDKEIAGQYFGNIDQDGFSLETCIQKRKEKKIIQ